MADPRDSNRRVQFGEAGPGVYLLLKNAGVRALYGRYGAEYFNKIERGINFGDIAIIEACLEVMAWKGDEKFDLNLDDLDNISLQDLIDRLLDAFTLATSGRKYQEQVAHVAAILAKQGEEEGDENPTMAPGDTSGQSNAEPTESD